MKPIPYCLFRPTLFFAGTIAGLLAISSQNVVAAPFTWDTAPGVPGAGDSTITGGLGTWNLSTFNWTADAGVNNLAWGNTNLDEAIFGVSGGVVTIDTGTGVIANKLTFNVDGYTIGGNVAADGLTLAGTAPTIAVTSATDTATINATVAGTTGLTKTGAGTLELTAANTFAGGVTLSAGTLKLSGGNNRIGTGQALTVKGTSLLDLGGNSQTLANIITENSTGGTTLTATISNGSLTVNGAGDFIVNSKNTTGTSSTILDLSGLSAFTLNKSANLVVQGGAYNTADQDESLKLSATANNITVNAINIGSQAANSLTADGVLELGAANTLYADTFNIGKTARATGTIRFQTGLPGTPSVTIRNKAGTGRANVYLSEQWGGGGTNTGTLDLTGGSVDAQLNTVEAGRITANATTGTGTITMGEAGGTMDITTLSLALASGTGAGTAAGTFTQNGPSSTVKVNSLVMGNNTGTGVTPTLNATYSLLAGTLYAKTIAPGTGTGGFKTTSVRKIDWTSGTIRNYDSASDLSINGVTGTGGVLTLNLLTAANHTFTADTGRTITQGSLSVIAGTGSLTQTGAGTLVLGGTNSHTGKTILLGGTTRISNENNLGANPGAFAADQLTLDGGTLQNTANVTIDDTNRGITLGASGGTFNTNASTTLIIASEITGAGALTKSGTGILEIKAAPTYTGDTIISAGRLRMNFAGSHTVDETVSGAGGFDVTQGTVNITSSSFNIGGALSVGVGGNFAPILNWTGTGTVGNLNTNDQGSLANPTININGGSLTVAGSASDTAYPWFNNSVFLAGKGPSTTNVNGGSFIISSNKRLIVAGLPRYGGPVGPGPYPQIGSLNVTGGLVDAQGSADLWVAYAQDNANATFASTGTIRLDGGTFQTSRTIREFVDSGALDPSSTVVFNGGTLKAGTTDNPLWIAAGAVDNLNIEAGGATIDTNGRDMEIAMGFTGTGGLTKTGDGTLTLSGTNTYQGATLVSNGTLLVNGSLANTSTVTIGSNGRIAGSGSISGAVTINGILAPGNSIDEITFAAGLSLAGTSEFEIDPTVTLGLNADLATVTGGGLSYGGILNVTYAGSNTDFTDGQIFNLFDWTSGAPTGAFTVVNLPDLTGTGLSWEDNLMSNGTLTVVPEPRAALLGSLGIIALLRRRRN